jgi:mono/diheme cytochrome c family protein
MKQVFVWGLFGTGIACLWAQQVTPVPGVAAPKVGADAKIQATQNAIRMSKQDPAAVARGNKLFVENCGYCHGATSKGTDIGPDLMRSATVLDDEKGELLFPKVRSHSNKTAISASLTDEQLGDIDAWLKAQYVGVAMRNTYDFLNIVVGDAKKGEAYFNGAGKCGTCHSITGDLAGIGKTDPQQLQSQWVSGIPSQQAMMAQAQAAGRGRGPAALGGGDQGTILFNVVPMTLQKITPTITVTLADGQKLEGVNQGIDDFIVAMRDMQGNYHRWPREGDFPKVETHNPRQAHFDLIRQLTDDDMHNVTAYLVTIK